MPSGNTSKVLYAAIGSNCAIAVCKYAAAAFTGSAAMLAEAVHSTVDIGNELLLMAGIKRSARPPDALHPFGHGKVLYFYSFLVAVYIFGGGGVFAIYQGISHMRRPLDATHIGWSYAVLAIAAALDGYSWLVSFKALAQQKDPNESLWQEIIGSKDPTVFTIFLEDSAALAGILLAFLGIFLGQLLHNPYLDPVASILIGLLLTAIAVLLGRESGALLVGERTTRSRIQQIKDIIVADPAVQRVGDILTMQLGPEQALLAVDIKFREHLDVHELEAIIDRLEARIQQRDPTIKRIFIEVDALRRSQPTTPARRAS